MGSVPATPRPIRTDDEGSMARKTARDRWPTLVQGMIDDVKRAEGQKFGAERASLVDALTEMQADIKSNQELVPLEEDGGPDIGEYNRKLKVLGRWQEIEWLFAECYLYRRVQTLFARSAHWKGYDVFKRQKDAAFASSSRAVHELVARFNEVLEMDRNLQARALFDEMIQISLWGNATDLSLLSTIANGELESMQGISAMEASKAKIVDDDSEALWQHMASTRQVDIVLDNAGFEFLTDLILAAYLLHAGLAQNVVLHTKAFGWFVSDVTPSDVESTLAALEDPTVFSERESLDPFCKMLRDHFTSGKISVAPVSTFWTTYHPFSDLATSDPGLLKTLEASSLVIFKGDLNYRKLTADKTWPYTTLFDVALEDLRKSRMHILALRTNKADVCVGLRSEDQVAELERLKPGAGWVSNGEYAVISFSTAT